jgi:uncharacterized membrane protein
MVFFQRMLLVIGVLGLIPFVLSECMTQSIPVQAWLCLSGSGIWGGIYVYSLARAYGAGDFSVVYPVARALPVLLVGLGDVLRARPMTVLGGVGLLLVVVGCLLTPLHALRECQLRRYLQRPMLWIVGAALGTVGYTLLDKIASEVVTPGPGTALRYCYVFFSLSGIVLWGLCRIKRLPQAESALGACRRTQSSFERPFDRLAASACIDDRTNIACFGLFASRSNCSLSGFNDGFSDRLLGWRLPLVGALCFFASYGLVLWAYQLSDRAGYVLAFRQFSIIIGVTLAFLIYRERWSPVRAAGVGLICAGLVLVGAYGG